MSLYNLINDYNPSVLFILPMLGKHPDMYPRFRNCFLSDVTRPDLDDHIHVYTRTGGPNRESFEEQNNAMRAMPGYVTDFDDEEDNTYASWVFKVPEQWQKDFDVYVRSDGKPGELSAEYREQMKLVYPKLAEALNLWFQEADKEPAA